MPCIEKGLQIVNKLCSLTGILIIIIVIDLIPSLNVDW